MQIRGIGGRFLDFHIEEGENNKIFPSLDTRCLVQLAALAKQSPT